MLETTLPKLEAALKKEGYEVNQQQETEQIYVVFKILDHEFPLFVKIHDQSDLLQLLIFLPIELKVKHIAATARLLHALNKYIDLPGFGIDEESGTIFYRLMVPYVNNHVAKELFIHYVNATKVACETFATLIQGVNQGVVELKDVLKQMKRGE